MLKNIKLHVAADETLQKEYEEKLAKIISGLENKNINAFERYVPTLLPIVKAKGSRNISLICNKTGEFNLVDYGQGRVFYGFHPEEEALQHIANFAENAMYVDISESSDFSESSLEPEKKSPESKDQQNSPSKSNDVKKTISSFKQLPVWEKYQQFSALPEELDCLVLLGCGLGYQISYLLKHHKIKHLIVYEPEGQYFQCSTHILDWAEIFSLAKVKETSIYLQIGKDGRDILADLSQLAGIITLQGFYIYKHYHHPMFGSIYDAFLNRSWHDLKEHGISFSTEPSYLDYIPSWSPCSVSNNYQDVDLGGELFKDNLDAFKEYFPDIHKEFNEYKPVKWLPVVNKDGQINIVHMNSLTNWYSESPKQDCQTHYENFNLQPHKDGLALGYTGKKLRHYRHYKFVAKTEAVLKEIEEVKGSLPEKIKSIIMFGLGSGYQLETLYNNHDIDYIFVCEPNRDFFYASLFAIPWADILKSVADNKQRIYLNIGDDGSNLTRDLINQFYSIGPYLVNSTYFYQSYFNSNLNAAIAQLREQLQVIIAMGEYFDHAWYGTHQTQYLLRNSAPVLFKKPGQFLSFDDKEVPVFVIGNGPSIDIAIEYLHEYRDQVILVSCGTALRVLHKHGITPDFQAEIEQNRTTYDWAALVDDLEYLKKISLISCNGIHPDTSSLYKDVYIAFKDGESSTVAALNVLGEEDFETLKFAFPTVANFAIDLFTSLEFTNIYLVGIDLGFVNKSHHHSKSSSYYLDNGKELYNYSEENNTSLLVPGNFRPVVNTKHEFKISRVIIEQILSLKNKKSQVYNTSDGAKISGTFPLRIENLLITTTVQQRLASIQAVKEKSFKATDGADFGNKFDNRFKQHRIVEEIDRLLELIESPPETLNQAEKYIEKQKLTLFSAYERKDNLLFYFLYGTSNYANAFLSKLLCAQTDEEGLPPQFFKGLTMWETFLSDLKDVLTVKTDIWDNSHFNLQEREFTLLRNCAKNRKVLMVSNSTGFIKAFMSFNDEKLKYQSEFTYCDASNIPNEEFDYVIYNNLPEYGGHFDTGAGEQAFALPIKGGINTFVFVYEQEIELFRLLEKHEINDVSFISFVRDCQNDIMSRKWADHQAYLALWMTKMMYDDASPQVYLPKYFLCDADIDEVFTDSAFMPFEPEYRVSDFKFYLGCNVNGQPIELLSTCGTRGSNVDKSAYGDYEKVRVYFSMSRKDYCSSVQDWVNKVPEIAQEVAFSDTIRK